MLPFTMMLVRLAAAASWLAAVTAALGAHRQEVALDEAGAGDFQCDLPPTVAPANDGLPSAQELFTSQDALTKQVERHAAIVKIPTISYDDSGEPGEDPRWNIFYELHRAFAYLYPHV